MIHFAAKIVVPVIVIPTELPDHHRQVFVFKAGEGRTDVCGVVVDHVHVDRKKQIVLGIVVEQFLPVVERTARSLTVARTIAHEGRRDAGVTNGRERGFIRVAPAGVGNVVAPLVADVDQDGVRMVFENPRVVRVPDRVGIEIGGIIAARTVMKFDHGNHFQSLAPGNNLIEPRGGPGTLPDNPDAIDALVGEIRQRVVSVRIEPDVWIVDTLDDKIVSIRVSKTGTGNSETSEQ